MRAAKTATAVQIYRYWNEL